MAKPIGISPKNPKDYLGPKVFLIQTVDRDRDPTTADYKYPIQTIWRNNVTYDEWILVDISSNLANWVMFTGGSIGSVIEFNVDNGANVTANAGVVTVTGAQVAAATSANGIRSDGSTANTLTLQINRAGSAASETVAQNGIAHFNSADFTVSNGFVSLVGATPFTWLVVNEMGTPASLVNNVGYICASNGVPSALSFALPATSAVGDIIELVLNGATKWTITQAAGQQIRWSGSTTTLGNMGSLATTGTGDSIRMVCHVANTIWAGLSGNGNLTVV